MVWPVPQILSKLFPERTLGGEGERLAARYLKRKGYRFLMYNYRVRGGEIDVIVCRGDLLVFVEVKTRTSDEYAAPHQQVTAQKQHRLTRAARAYLRHYGMDQPRVRFDVVSIVWPDAGEPEIEHIENAFEAT